MRKLFVSAVKKALAKDSWRLVYRDPSALYRNVESIPNTVCAEDQAYSGCVSIVEFKPNRRKSSTRIYKVTWYNGTPGARWTSQKFDTLASAVLYANEITNQALAAWENDLRQNPGDVAEYFEDMTEVEKAALREQIDRELEPLDRIKDAGPIAAEFGLDREPIEILGCVYQFPPYSLQARHHPCLKDNMQLMVRREDGTRMIVFANSVYLNDRRLVSKFPPRRRPVQSALERLLQSGNARTNPHAYQLTTPDGLRIAHRRVNGGTERTVSYPDNSVVTDRLPGHPHVHHDATLKAWHQKALRENPPPLEEDDAQYSYDHYVDSDPYDAPYRTLPPLPVEGDDQEITAYSYTGYLDSDPYRTTYRTNPPLPTEESGKYATYVGSIDGWIKGPSVDAQSPEDGVRIAWAEFTGKPAKQVYSQPHAWAFRVMKLVTQNGADYTFYIKE